MCGILQSPPPRSGPCRRIVYNKLSEWRGHQAKYCNKYYFKEEMLGLGLLDVTSLGHWYVISIALKPSIDGTISPNMPEYF